MFVVKAIWNQKFPTDPWSECRWWCYCEVLASRQPTPWTCSVIRESSRSVWCCSLHLMQILSGRQPRTLSLTLPVSIWTLEIGWFRSHTHTAPQYVVLGKTQDKRFEVKLHFCNRDIIDYNYKGYPGRLTVKDMGYISTYGIKRFGQLNRPRIL